MDAPNKDIIFDCNPLCGVDSNAEVPADFLEIYVWH